MIMDFITTYLPAASSSSSSRSSSSSSRSSSKSSSSKSSSKSPPGHCHHGLKLYLLQPISEEEKAMLIDKYKIILSGMSSSKMEDFLIKEVIDGNLTAEQALVIAIAEGVVII